MSPLDPAPSRSHGDAAAFALHCADALSGVLNLRRTLGRVIDLAVPRLGGWAEIALDDGDRIRHVTSHDADGGGPGDRTLRGRSVSAEIRARLRRLATEPVTSASGRDADRSAALTAPVGIAAALGVPPEHLVVTSVALDTQAADVAVLTVAGLHPPSAEELAGLARRGARAVSAAHLYEERATLAATLRAALVPPPLPVVAGVELGASFRPAQETTQVGGDFYEVHGGGGTWSFTLGDVCGKGVDAAVLTGQVRQSLRTAARISSDPVERLELVNDTLLSTDGDNYFTVLHGVLTIDGAPRIRLAAGGHPAPLLLRHGVVEEVPVKGTLIGMLPAVAFDPADIELGPGDLLLGYTDGAVEARGEHGLLGPERLAEELADCDGMPAQAVTDRLMQLVLEHLDGRRHDDIALLAVRADETR